MKIEFSRQILEKKICKRQISCKPVQSEPRFSLQTDK